MHRLHRATGRCDKAIDCPGRGPLDNTLERIVHRTDHLPVRSGDHLRTQQQLTDPQRFTFDQAPQQIGVGAAVGIACGWRQVIAGDRPVLWPFTEVDPDHLLDRGKLARLVDARVGLHEQLAGLLAGVGQVQAQAGQQTNVGGAAAVFFRATGQIAAQLERGFDIRCRCKHQVGNRSGKVTTRVRGAGLHQRDSRVGVHRQVERTLDLQVSAGVVDGANL
ncbi:hypothetical protein D3C79_571640 [compost metagenome]